MFRKDLFLAQYYSLFSLMIILLLYLLPSAALFMLTMWSSSPSVPSSVETTQEALIRLEHWCLPLNPSKREASFHQANLQPNLLFNSRLRLNHTPTFLGVTFGLTLSFSKHVSSLKSKFFSRLKALRCIYASSRGLSKKSFSLLHKGFLRPLLTYASPGWFPFLSVFNITKLECLHQPAIRVISGCLPFSLLSLLLSKASLPPLTHFTLSSYARALRLPNSFPISDLARLGVKPRLYRSSWRAFAFTYPLMLPFTSPREVPFACAPFPPWNLHSYTKESTLSSPCSRSDLPFSCQGAALTHLDSLPLHDLVLCSFSFWQRRLWGTCQLLTLWH